MTRAAVRLSWFFNTIKSAIKMVKKTMRVLENYGRMGIS